MKDENQPQGMDVVGSSEKPLQSWKEIAAYLERGERTARRWEKTHGLPIRRHGEGKGSSVFAYPTELDAWRTAHGPQARSVHVWRSRMAAALVGGMILLAGAFMLYGPILNPPNPVVEAAEGVTLRRVSIGGPDIVTLGSPSADGRFLTFQASSEDLAVRDLNTGEARVLTHKDPRSLEFCLLSELSPDGKKVAFSWYNEQNFIDLRTVNMDGSDLRVLFSKVGLADVEPADWSPDGGSLLVVLTSKDRTRRLALLSTSDGSLRVLRSFPTQWPSRARFSPDGRYVAYDLLQEPGSGNSHDIFLLDVEGNEGGPVIQHPGDDLLFDWTPDGRRILFGSDRSGSMGAWSIRINGGRPLGSPELVKADLGQGVKPMGFTQGGAFYYGLKTGMTDVFRAEIDLETGQIQAGPVPVNPRFVGSSSSPDWSADGRQLLFLSKRGRGVWGARVICLLDNETGEVRELASTLDRVVLSRWFPGRQTLFVAAEYPRGKFGPFQIAIDTGNFERLDLQRPLGWGPAWSPDGETIYYQQWEKRSQRVAVAARNLTTGHERVVHRVEDGFRYCSAVAPSPDGTQLAVAQFAPESGVKIITIVSLESGAERTLLREDRMPFPASLVWARNGQSIVYVKQPVPDEAQTELWQAPIAGNQSRKLDIALDQIRDLALHPDGRQLAFTAGKDREEVWVLEGFLAGH